VISLLMGDCRVTLSTLPERSVQTCITSPPYYGLRDYGLAPLVWGGDAEHEHEWGVWGHSQRRSGGTGASGLSRDGRAEDVRLRGALAATLRQTHDGAPYAFCPCGAWLGSLGLEPTPKLYIEHLVEVFREVRRVLRDDGTIWLNLGDSYAGSGKGPSNSLQGEASCIGARERGLLANRRVSGARGSAGPAHGKRNTGQFANGQAPTSWIPIGAGYKPKDLMMLPARVAMALQADGWYLRSMIPWLKRNSMPESVNDRPATSVEYIFLLSKSRTYYWDADAVRLPHFWQRDGALESNAQARQRKAEYERMATGDLSGLTTQDSYKAAIRGERGKGRGEAGNRKQTYRITDAGRNRRNSDWFLESWQGLLLDEQDEPLALVVNPAPFKESHFATFPPKLVEPMVKASTSERGCCPECGAPWVRVSESEQIAKARNVAPDKYAGGRDERGGTWTAAMPAQTRKVITTTGWRPTCKHDAQPVPCTILDPFGGSGTVGMVADRLGRNAILCELKPDYSQMGAVRVTNDAPMFVQMELR
jgi:DNA modification methylase